MRFASALLLAAALLVAFHPGAWAEDRPVTIGAIYNLTGGQEDLDIPSSRGARLAVDRANAEGGVLGRPVTMVVVDGQTMPAVIAQATGRLFQDQPQIAGLIGLSDTDMVLAAAPVAAEHGRIFLTSGATSPLLPRQVPDYLFLACFGDNVQAAAGAEWAYAELKARTVVVLYKQSSSYAELLHSYFETRFKQLGGKVLAVVPYTLADFARVSQTLPKADLIYLAAQPDDIATAIPALRATAAGRPILGGDGLDIGTAWAGIGHADHVYFTTHTYLGADNPDATVKDFLAAYAKAHPGEQPDAFTALGYDAARLLMAAIGKAGTTEPRAVRDALAGTTNFAGVTGTISFTGGSQIPVKSVTVMAIDGGHARFEANVLPKDVPPP